MADRSVVRTSQAETVAESPPGLQAAVAAAAVLHKQGESLVSVALEYTMHWQAFSS